MSPGPDVTRISRDRRWALLGQRGAAVWFTGLPAAGKSTLAAMLEERLLGDGRFVYMLDGGDLRHGLSGDLDFTREARSENARRAAHVARVLADSGAIAIVALISPYAKDRDRARALHEAERLGFVEVFVSTPLAECERRDPKGLYARARRGKLPGFTGVDDAYEPPAEAEIELDTSRLGASEGVERIVSHLGEQGLIPALHHQRSPGSR
jgi:adenylyl-sulfate kinase